MTPVQTPTEAAAGVLAALAAGHELLDAAAGAPVRVYEPWRTGPVELPCAYATLGASTMTPADTLVDEDEARIVVRVLVRPTTGGEDQEQLARLLGAACEILDRRLKSVSSPLRGADARRTGWEPARTIEVAGVTPLSIDIPVRVRLERANPPTP